MISARIVLLVTTLAALAACSGAPAAPAQPIAHGTVTGYTEVTTGHHVVDIDLFDKPAGAPAPYTTVGYAHEGQRVEVIEQHDDGTIKVRTPDGVEGWTQIDFVTDIK